MITFKQFLAEEDKPQILDWLWKHCAPFLRECGLSEKDTFSAVIARAVLIRGIKGSTGEKIRFLNADGAPFDAVIKTVRKDRRARDTNTFISEIINDELTKKFGWPARSEGVFAFGTDGEGEAADFGRPHRIYPISEFQYVWSPEIKDLTIHINRMLQKHKILFRGYSESYDEEEQAQIRKAFVTDLLPSYIDHGLKDALKTSREVMIQCNSYLACPYS